MAEQHEKYYVPAQSPWPIVGSIGLFLIAVGAGTLVPDITSGKSGYGGWILTAGIAVIIFMMVGWFRHVIHESMNNLYSAQMDRSFRMGMMWFIFSEVMFFMAFFGALFYARVLAVSWLGEGSTQEFLWPDFESQWPLVKTPGGTETTAMGWQGLPLYNTLILITSSVTCWFAEKGLETNNRKQITIFLGITVLLGIGFLFLQVEEYLHAYQEMNLRLDSGIYGNTFFMLTGFHGMHVTIGTLMLFIMFIRVAFFGHFSKEKHFAFQATAWYWHFVDFVWVGLFIFVYIL